MAARFFLVLLLGILCFRATGSYSDPTPYPSGTKIVHRIISIDVKNTPLGKVLRLIEQKAYFKFSYNADIIDEEKPVTLKLENQSVLTALKQLFNETIRYKEAGNHLILLKNNASSDQLEKTKTGYYFTGKVMDSETGKPVSGASIYDVEARQASISDESGNYHITLETGEPMRGFYCSKTGYLDTTLVVLADVSLQNNIVLRPVNTAIEKLPGNDVQLIFKPIEERPISKQIISEETYIHSENLKAIQETRIAQVSLIPSVSIGSDLSTNGLVVNHFSLNVLAGYSNGVFGCEIGGILNINKNDMIGCQVGGIGNLTGGKVYGVQVGGISNIVLDNVLGVQVGGINNLVRGHVTGIQVGGISNVISGGFNGLQVAGINNFAKTSSHGLQVAGINNVVADTLYGGQIAGIGNWARRGINTCQISGFANIAYINKGIQVSGFYNYTRINNGFQVGLINSCVSGEGTALGLISYCQEGYRSTEISANEVFPLNLTFKTGVNKLYNSYSFGVHYIDRPRYGFGMGLGTKIPLGKRISISTDLMAYLIQMDNFDSFQGNELYRLSASFDIRVAKWLSFYLGPDFNIGFSRYINAEGNYETFMNYEPLTRINNSSSQLQSWVGAQAGVRFGIER